MLILVRILFIDIFLLFMFLNFVCVIVSVVFLFFFAFRACCDSAFSVKIGSLFLLFVYVVMFLYGNFVKMFVCWFFSVDSVL